MVADQLLLISIQNCFILGLILLGLTTLVKPHLLHHLDHIDNQDHKHDPFTSSTANTDGLKHKKTTGTALFGIGFDNMIIPCPTGTLMYSFALESGGNAKARTVFTAYAFSTGLAVRAVTYGILRVNTLLRTLGQDWIETVALKTIGAMTVFFWAFSLYLSP